MIVLIFTTLTGIKGINFRNVILKIHSICEIYTISDILYLIFYVLFK